MTGGRSSAPLAEFCRQFDQRIDEIARRLLGEPNRPMSSRTQLRFGRHGSLAVEIAGAKRGHLRPDRLWEAHRLLKHSPVLALLGRGILIIWRRPS